MIKHTPNFRRWVNRIAIISLSIGITSMGVIFYYTYQQSQINHTTCKEWLAERIIPIPIEAEVVEISQESTGPCSSLILLQGEGPTKISLCECPENEKILAWVEKGDSIFKKSMERTLYVKKNQDSIRSFAFPCCE